LRGWRAALGVAGLLLALGLGGTGQAEVRPVEAVGVVPLDADAPSRVPPRDAAMQRALQDAVHRVALDELPDFDPATGGEELAVALGDDPSEFATRYRIREDRGERPALFSDDPEVESEYVVVVEVHVDVDRVRERLIEAGLLLMPSGDDRRYRVRVVIEEVESYAAYMAVRTLLEELGLRSVLPVEMERGRVVLRVDGHRSPDQLMSGLLQAASSNLRLVPLGIDAESLTLRASFQGAPAARDPGGWPGAPPIDTPDPNRY
jgi:hypothetical protein